MKKIIGSIVLMTIGIATCYGQAKEGEVIADLKKQLKTETIDTSRIFLLGDLANLLIKNGDTISAIKAIKEGLTLSEKRQFDYGFGHLYIIYGNYYETIADYSSAQKYYQLSYDYFKKSDYPNAPLGAASSLGNLGLIAERQGDIEKAIQLKLEGLSIWERSNVPQKVLAMGNSYVGIASLYAKQGQFQKAIEYDKKGIEIRLKYNYRDSDLGTCYVYLSNNYVRNKQLDSAQKYLSIAEQLSKELKNSLFDLRLKDGWARFYLEKKNYTKAIEVSIELKQKAAEAKKAPLEYNAAMVLGHAYFSLEQWNNAIGSFKEALAIATRINIANNQTKAMQELAKSYSRQGNYKEAFFYLTNYNTLNDSLKREEMTLKLNDIDTKYQTAQKENQILTLEKEKQQQNTLIYGLLAGLVGLVVLATLVYQNTAKQKRIAQQQAILREQELIQLKQQQQLMATNALMKGQEEERKRVARDLHDGLGGLLSGIKLTLTKVRGNFILPEDGMSAFSRALTQLDTAISEMRRVAHSMMPEALVHYGLPEAIKDFCEDITESGAIMARFQALGMTSRLESSTEVVLYRIVQELLNNVLKHAQASEVYVQLIRKDNILNITVEDNGKGFEATGLDAQKGSGMRNIYNRVAYLNGKIDYQSQLKEGTSVFVEIPLTT